MKVSRRDERYGAQVLTKVQKIFSREVILALHPKTGFFFRQSLIV